MYSTKRLGILGGLGPESTVEYYRATIEAARRLEPPFDDPSILINSISLGKVRRLLETSDLPGLADYLVSELQVLADAGAALGIIAANTPHIVFDQIRGRSPLPLLSIVDAAYESARSMGWTRVGLLGTRFTMQGRFYSDVFSRAAIEVISPSEADQTYVHDVYMNELIRNTFLPSSRDGLLAVVDRLVRHGKVHGVLLAGTELPLLLPAGTASSVPLLDTGAIQAAAAATRLWQEPMQ